MSGALGGFTDLYDFCSAERATFVSNAGEVSGAGSAWVFVLTGGNLGNSTFIGNPATVSGAEGGWVEIDAGILAGANFIANGAAVAGAQGGQIYVYGGSGSGSFTGYGGTGEGAGGGLIDLFRLPDSDQTIVVAEGGTNGGLGGTILVEGHPSLGSGQFQVFGNGVLDLVNLTTRQVTIGSLAGDGIVFLAGHSLTIGSNDKDTVFSGVIEEEGGLAKIGVGTLTLSGANTYTGTTTIGAGTLIVSNRSGSGTGTGSVKMHGGTMGGKGVIGGPVTIGTGTGSGAVLAPSAGTNQPVTMNLKKTVTFKADSTYLWKLNTGNARADQIRARGISIESGARFTARVIGTKTLAQGTVLTAISNTSGNAVSGSFSNLPDQSTLMVGPNRFKVSYEGGDGNDLTLTVVP